MRASIISFTTGGLKLSRRAAAALEGKYETTLYTKQKTAKAEAEKSRDIHYVEESVGDWTKKRFPEDDLLVFIGACAIAVRSIAPVLKDKLSDTPVISMDEAGNFVIPLLAGHYGMANKTAEFLAEKLGAQAVITTATDVNHLFAVDVFARREELAILDREAISRVSSAILEGKTVKIWIDGPYTGGLPRELCMAENPQEADILVSPYRHEEARKALRLCPRELIVGIGCRSGKSAEELLEALTLCLNRMSLLPESIAALASIDLKKNEPGLLKLAGDLEAPLLTYSEKELNSLEGDFTPSSFVRKTTGTDNVCERAAVAALAGEAGELIMKKQAGSGVTVAFALRKRSVNFDEERD